MAEKTYRIVEVFDTIQGEGSRAGARSVFVRFTGCNAWNGRPQDRNVGKGACARWCDTEFSHGKSLTAKELLALMDTLWPRTVDDPVRWCVLTGGEPCLQLDAYLMNRIRLAGWRVAVETNGSIENLALRGASLVTISPKRGLPLARNFRSPRTQRFELKVALPGHVDPAKGWTDDELRRLAFDVPWRWLFVQPQDPIDPTTVESSFLHASTLAPNYMGKAYEANLARCIDFVKRHPEWRVSLQTHKLMQVR